MGIDVNLYAEGNVSDEELSAAQKFFSDRELRGTPIRDDWDDTPRITVDMDGARYWGPHYERGPWPDIFLCIIALRAALPNCTVHYGGDSEYDSPEMDREELERYWAHWLSPNWDDYHNRSQVVSR